MMMFSRGMVLLQDLGDDARAHRAAALADREPQLLLHRDRRDQLDPHLRVAPGHHHLHPRRQLHRPRHVRRPEVELRPVPLEEGRVPPPLLLRQHVHLALKLRVRRDRPRLRHPHPPLHLVLLHAAQQQPHVVPRLPLVQELAEHLHPRHHRLLVRPKPHHLHFLPHLHLPPLDPPRRHRPPARDREHVLHRHQERLVHLPLRHRNALVQGRQQPLPLRYPRLLPPHRLQGPAPGHRSGAPPWRTPRGSWRSSGSSSHRAGLATPTPSPPDRRSRRSRAPSPPPPSSTPPSTSSCRGPRARSSPRSRAAWCARISLWPWNPLKTFQNIVTETSSRSIVTENRDTFPRDAFPSRSFVTFPRDGLPVSKARDRD